jgi:hypothetical protein
MRVGHADDELLRRAGTVTGTVPAMAALSASAATPPRYFIVSSRSVAGGRQPLDRGAAAATSRM